MQLTPSASTWPDPIAATGTLRLSTAVGATKNRSGGTFQNSVLRGETFVMAEGGSVLGRRYGAGPYRVSPVLFDTNAPNSGTVPEYGTKIWEMSPLGQFHDESMY